MKTKNDKSRAVRATRKAFSGAWVRVGGLSAPSKMPGFGYGLPARRCKVGVKLARVKGSVCSGCYALKGNYRYDNVVRAQEARFASIHSPTWVQDMVSVIGSACGELEEPYFRWHDSGDLQDPRHLLNILQVARLLPHISFWLPTKEYGLLRLLSHMNVPANLNVRVSAPRVNKSYQVAGITSSSVSSKKTWVAKVGIPLPGATLCVAPAQEGVCGTCRVCWDKAVPEVTYKVH